MLWFWFLSLSFLSGCASVWKDYYKVYFVRLDMFLSSSICLPFRVYQTNYWHPIFSWNMHDAFTQWGGFVYKDNKQLANLYLFLVRNKLQSWCAIWNDCKLHFAQFSLTVYFIFWPCWIFSSQVFRLMKCAWLLSVVKISVEVVISCAQILYARLWSQAAVSVCSLAWFLCNVTWSWWDTVQETKILIPSM